MKNKYLIALPLSKNEKGFCCQTILVSALNEGEAIEIVKRLRPKRIIGSIKKVDY